MSNDYEDRIRSALAAQAARVDPHAAPEEIAYRAVRRERTKAHALSVGLAVALFAGPMLGFVAGRGDGGDAAAEESGDAVVVDESGTRPMLRSAPEPAEGAETLAAPGFADDTQMSRSEAEMSRGEDLALGPWGLDRPLARAFVREVEGARIRVYRADIEPPSGYDLPWWEPPGWCSPIGLVQADVSNEDAVGIVSGDVYRELREAPVGGSLGVIGIGEGAPLWVAVVQGTGGTATVRATFPGGATDEMDLVDGVAVLVAPADIEPGDTSYYEQTASVEAFDPGGNSLGSADVHFGGYWAAAEESMASECAAPRQLPPPGREQPPDPAAARAAIAQHFTGEGWDSITDAERLARLDDPRGIQEAIDQLVNGQYAGAVRAARTTLKDVVFLSPTEAVALTDVDIPGYGTAYHDQFSEFVLVDGVWKQTRESFCRLIASSGVTCPPVE